MPSKVWGGITYPFLNFNGEAVEVYGWISSFIPYFIMDVITYSCWDKSQTMLVKGDPDISTVVWQAFSKIKSSLMVAKEWSLNV